MLRTWLIRHAETDWNVCGRIQGQRDVDLNDRGRRQAERIAEVLGRVPFRAVYSSDLARCVETARPIVARLGLPLQTTPALRELSFGVFEGLTTAEARLRYPIEHTTWMADRAGVPPPGGETLSQLAERVAAAVETMATAVVDGDVLVVTHGGPLRALLCRCLGMDANRHWQFQLENASITVLEWSGRGPIVVQVNDLAHLRADGWIADEKERW